MSKERLTSFLESGRDNGGSKAGATTGKFQRDGNLSNNGRNVPNIIKQSTIENRIADSKTKGDQAWASRFANAKDGEGAGSSTDKSIWRGNNNSDKSNGIVNLQGDRRGGNDRKFDSQKFDPQKIDRNYQTWRKSAQGGKKGDFGDNRDWSGQWKKGDRFAAADGIRDHWKNNRNHNDTPFSGDWWNRHGNHNGHDGHDGHGGHDGHDGHGGHDGHHDHDGHWNNNWDHWGHFDRHHHNWWNWCSAPLLTGFFAFDFATPYYWDYGPGEYLYCDDGVVYVNGVWYEPAPTFYQRSLLFAQTAPQWTPVEAAAVDWLPLGVFAVSRDGVVDNNLLVQLAVTKEGVLGGTLFNQLTGVTFPIQGMVDKQSQRAVWSFTDDTNAQVVMESSIFNLTQPEATGLVHYGPDNIQVIELVRLEDPNAAP